MTPSIISDREKSQVEGGKSPPAGRGREGQGGHSSLIQAICSFLFFLDNHITNSTTTGTRLGIASSLTFGATTLKMSTKEEKARLIAVDPESGSAEGVLQEGVASRSSRGGASWSSWGKVAAGAGVLAVLGAAAISGGGVVGGGVLASLGEGLDLPHMPTAEQTAALIAAGGGGLGEERADFALAPGKEVVEAVLGRSRMSHYHHGTGSEKDDKQRDKAYIVPSIVINKLSEKIASSGSKKS